MSGEVYPEGAVVELDSNTAKSLLEKNIIECTGTEEKNTSSKK